MTLKNTDNAYRIIVSNTQTADGTTDTIKELAYGSYNEKNGKQYIIYKTEPDFENPAVSSIIIIDCEGITIRRHGVTNSSIVYSAGKKYCFPYETPYGIIDMEIETDKLISDVSENGGKIELQYTLTVQGEKYFNNTTIAIDKR